jgi:threonine synthase
MNLDEFPKDIRGYLMPEPSGAMFYRCLGCNGTFDADSLLYTCPSCNDILMLDHQATDEVEHRDGSLWRKIFDYRRMLNVTALKGIFRYYEFIAPVIPLESILYLGEGHTPLVMANENLQKLVGLPFYFKNEGLNPSLSFKDRGMACALSFLNHLIKERKIRNPLTICASTGDTSASGALYSAYLTNFVKSVVLLPRGKVTLQQLSQPLGSGATVLELPGVFDDCMKVVEELSENYDVALLNSKNSWRILGQETYSYEITQDFDYEVGNKIIVVPVGNAGNITAIMSGFLKFLEANVITHLPKIVGVQSDHADPVYRYYMESDRARRHFEPVAVEPSVAQAAMIGNPVSMPRVIDLVRRYDEAAGGNRVFFVSVSEQEIMDAMIRANRHGHFVCTQGGESMAGLIEATARGIVTRGEVGVLAATAHALKFSSFQEMYFSDSFPSEFEVRPKVELRNAPVAVEPANLDVLPEPGKPLHGEDLERFVRESAREIAKILGLKKR